MKKTPGFLWACALVMVLGTSRAEEVVRAEVGKPLIAAQELMRAGKNREALAKVQEAQSTPNRTPYEDYLIERIRGAAAAGAGDEAVAIKSFEAVLASGRLQGPERLQTMQALAGSAYQAKDYAKAIEWAQQYFKNGGDNDQVRLLEINAYYMSGDFAGVVKELQGRIQAAEQAAPVIDEPMLRLLAASQLKLGDDAGYVNTLEMLVAQHPTKDYWADLIARIQGRPGFAERLALDTLRLQMATQTLNETAQYVEMAQLAIQAGLPGEAKRVVDAGYAAARLGVGADAERHKRLRDLVNKQVAEDERSLATDVIGRSADALVNTGQSLVAAGRVDRGVAMMEQGIAKGGLKHPEDAKLHLAQTYVLMGNKAKAIETFKSVRGADGTADLARLWAIWARQSAVN